MNTSKYSVLFFVLIFIGSQILLIANEFAATRIIEVRKEIYDGNEKDYLKGYEIVNAPFEQFDILVKPKSFWDYLLHGGSGLRKVIWNKEVRVSKHGPMSGSLMEF